MHAQNDRRTPSGRPLRNALMKLRLVEFEAAKHLPEDIAVDLAAAIEGVVEQVRRDAETECVIAKDCGREK